MRQFAALDEVITLLESGEWELGYFDGIRSDGTYQLQKGGLRKGGLTVGVRASTIRALERRKLITAMPRQPNEPFWMRRYRFLGVQGTGKDEKVSEAVSEAKNVPTGLQSPATGHRAAS